MNLHYGVIGLGPIGTTIATLLAQKGKKVTLLAQDKAIAENYLKSPIQISGALSAHKHFQSIYVSMGDFVASNPDVILVATKGYDAAVVYQSLKRAGLKKETVLVACQNGLDVEKLIEDSFSSSQALRMILNIGASFTQNNYIVVNFNFPHVLSIRKEVSESLIRQIARDLTESGFVTEARQDYRDEVFKKVILNASLSSVCAITGTTMQTAMANAGLKGIVTTMVGEACQIGRASGFNVPNGFEQHALEYLNKGGNHKPSMAIDIEKKRPTENQYHCGKLIEYASKAGISAPVTNTIYQLLKGIEEQFSKETI